MIRSVTSILLVTLFLAKNLFSAEGMPQFNADTFPSQLFWLIVTFLVLYACMNFLVLPRIRDNIRLRKNKISNDIERAELLKEQIENTVNEYENRILQAKNQAEENVKNSIEKANKEFASQLETAKKNIIQKINNTEARVKDYKKNITNEIDEVSIDISSVIIEKVIGKGLSKNEIDIITRDSSKMKEQ